VLSIGVVDDPKVHPFVIAHDSVAATRSACDEPQA
jgi:hypothetical protein